MVHAQLAQRLSNPTAGAVRIGRLQRAAQLERLVGRLIHDRPPVDHVDQPPRQPHRAGGSLLGKRNQPDRHHRGLSEPGRQIEGGRNRISYKQIEQSILPPHRRVAGQQRKTVIEPRHWIGLHASSPKTYRTQQHSKFGFPCVARRFVVPLLCILAMRPRCFATEE
jgi:hypothetical protein